MLIICNDLSTKNPVVSQALKDGDTDAITKIAANAKTSGFNALELYAGEAKDEAKALISMIESVKDTELKLIIRAKDNSVFAKVMPKAPGPQIIAPSSLSVQEAKELFKSLFKSDQGWQVLLGQNFGDDKFERELDGFNALISAAEQSGIMPERIYLEALVEPLLKTEHPFLKMQRVVNALENIYPDVNFYLSLPLIAEGLEKESVLMNVFIGMASPVGIGAYSFGSEHKTHLEAVKAAQEFLSFKESFKDFV